jgi:predicted DNA-binding antitoxin AbrB/MazE fold protein
MNPVNPFFKEDHNHLSAESQKENGETMSGAIKARYENKVLKPLGEINLKEGEEVEIELKKKNIFGLLQGWKIDAQSLKDELREING